jgi:hypothetical protein
MATPSEIEATDKGIAEGIANIFKAQTQVPADSIKFEVRKGVVTLSGQVDYEFQRLDAEKLIEEVKDVKFIDNEIIIRKQGMASAASTPILSTASKPISSAAPTPWMKSNSQDLFEQISKALYRAGMFVSCADLKGGEKAWHEEMKAIDIVLHVMQKQNSKESFMEELTQLAAGEFESLDSYKAYPDPDHIKSLQHDLESVPDETEAAVRAVLENFSKDEARVYSDLLLSVGAAVGKAYDKKDDYVTGYFLANTEDNIQQIIERILGHFSRLQQDETAKYLYDENSVFDQMAIGDKDSIALGQLSSATRKAWLEKYPQDINQTVQDYLREHPEEA